MKSPFKDFFLLAKFSFPLPLRPPFLLFFSCRDAQFVFHFRPPLPLRVRSRGSSNALITDLNQELDLYPR